MGEQENKRQFKRVNQYLKVRYYFGNNTEPVQVYTEDISLGGIRIHNPFPIDERYQFPMHIFLSGESGNAVNVIARVAWQRKQEGATGWEMGIEFVQIQDSDRQLIANFLK